MGCGTIHDEEEWASLYYVPHSHSMLMKILTKNMLTKIKK